MLLACWSVKGGSGTTVVAAALATLAARSTVGGALLVDLAGDAAAALGVPGPASPGASAWLAAGDDVPADALTRLEVPVGGGGLRLLPWGDGPVPGDPRPGPRASVLARLLAAEHRPVVVDCGDASGPGAAVLATAATALLVLRPCFLSLRAARHLPVRPTGIVVVGGAGRGIGPGDVEGALDAPVVAVVDDDLAVAHAVDAGSLAGRLPRSLRRSLRHVA